MVLGEVTNVGDCILQHFALHGAAATPLAILILLAVFRLFRRLGTARHAAHGHRRGSAKMGG